MQSYPAQLIFLIRISEFFRIEFLSLSQHAQIYMCTCMRRHVHTGKSLASIASQLAHAGMRASMCLCKLAAVMNFLLKACRPPAWSSCRIAGHLTHQYVRTGTGVLGATACAHPPPDCGAEGTPGLMDVESKLRHNHA